MKNLLVLSVIILFIQIGVFAQGFERVYPYPDDRGPVMMRSDNDSLYIIYSHSGSDRHYGSAKIDFSGNIKYKNPRIDSFSTNAWFVRSTFGIGNSLIVVSGKEITSYNKDLVLTKYDSTETPMWVKHFGDTLDEVAFVVKENHASSIFLLVYLWGDDMVRIMKFDSLGNELWTTQLNGSPRSLEPTPDGGCVANIHKYIGGGFRDQLYKFDAFGDTTNFNIGMITDGYFPDMLNISQDSGFITSCRYDVLPNNPAGETFAIKKYSSNLDSVWQFVFFDTTVNYTQPSNMIKNSQDEWLVIGTIYDISTSNTIGFYLMKISAAGNLLWMKSYNVGPRSPYDIIQLNNGDIYIYGSIRYPGGGSDLWLFMTDSLGKYTDNSLTGIVYFEEDNTCFYDSTETGLANWLVGLDGSYASNYINSNQLGEYYVQTQIDSYIVNIYPLSPYWDPCFEDSLQVFTKPVQNDTLHIGVQPIVYCPWLELSVASNCWVRPGGRVFYTIEYCNYGTAPAYLVEVNVTLPPEVDVYNVTVPYTQNGQVINVSIDSLNIGECRRFRLSGIVDSNIIAPSTLCVLTQIKPDSICLPDYNGYNPSEKYFCNLVITSFDPNLKAANPFGEGTEHYISNDTLLNYNIQFQNTGTDTAFKVVIIDTLPPELDVSTIKPGASSHDYTYDVYGQGIVRFTFDPIALPDSNVNEPASHGYVGFSIQMKADLPDETTIENTAAIYFDFNEPVITEPWIYTIGEYVSIDEPFVNEDMISLYPNPGNGNLRIVNNNNTNAIEQIEVYDVIGNLLFFEEQTTQSTTYELNLSKLPRGIKIIRLKVGGQVVVKKYVLLK